MSTLVLVHPIGLDSACWQFVGIPEAVAVDLPGHGTRHQSTGPLSLSLMADEIAGSVEGQLDVVGCSLGGAVAQHLAVRHPARVRSLLLACTGAKMDRAVLLSRAEAAEDQGVLPMIESTLERWFSPALLSDRSNPAIVYAESSLRRIDSMAFSQAWRALADHDLRGRLLEVRAPVTVVGGLADSAAPVALIQALHASIPGARLRLLDGPHMLPLECPAEFRAVVNEHLAAVRL